LAACTLVCLLANPPGSVLVHSFKPLLVVFLSLFLPIITFLCYT
jgi:hypothetical protein